MLVDRLLNLSRTYHQIEVSNDQPSSLYSQAIKNLTFVGTLQFQSKVAVELCALELEEALEIQIRPLTCSECSFHTN